MGDLDGRTVIISGVGEGLGRETALAATRQGGNVVLGARTEATLEKVASEVEAAGGKAVWIRTDITNPDDCQAIVDLALKEFGRVDGLINVAALDAVFGGLLDADLEQWKQVFDVNFFGTLTLCRCAIPALREQKGSIVIVSSQTHHHPTPAAFQTAYGSSKAALSAAMRYLAHEVGPDGINVNEIAPGWMWGPPVEGYVNMMSTSRGVDPDVVLSELCAPMALRRMATDEEVAESLVFFASPRAGGTTGQTLLINAGEIVK